MLTLLVAGVVAMAIAASSPARADDPYNLRLQHPDSLVGWDHGPKRPIGWQVSGTTFSGDDRSSTLISGWTWAAFELRFDWSVEPGSTLRLDFPREGTKSMLTMLLAENDSCGALFDGPRLLASGGDVAPSEGGKHTAVIRRWGEMFALLVDGRELYRVTIDAGPRMGLRLSVDEGAGAFANLTTDEPVGRSMFAGVDLTGWYSERGLESWRVQDGELMCQAIHTAYLRSEEEFGNFTLSFEYKMKRGGNSGVGIRTPRTGWPSSDGMELQLLDEPAQQTLSGSSEMGVYRNVAPLARNDRSEQWNRVVIKAEGYMISAWVNGQLTQHVNTAQHSELRHRHLRGWIGFQDHSAWLRVRNVHVLPAPDGLGPAAWYARHDDEPALALVDRLMNTERLTLPDGVEAGVVTTSLAEAGDVVLADLDGPGALIGVTASSHDGRVALYFDDEKQPRIECPLQQLGQHVPRLSRPGQPLLTCVGYANHLRVELKEGAPGQYRLEYVDMPDRAKIGSYDPGNDVLERTMMPALDYHLDHFSHGTQRGLEATPTYSSEPTTLGPGETKVLLERPGAGVVRWWRLDVPHAALGDDNLWVEVTVDGEESPAVSAPVRYLMAGLPGSDGGFDNYLVLYKDGYEQNLAMPLGGGIKIALSNHGDAPIEPVSVTALVAEASPGDVATAARMRLRSVFVPAQPAGDAAVDIVKVEGQGRLVGLIQQVDDGNGPAIESLTIDGTARDGWASEDMAGFFRLYGVEGDARHVLSGRANGLAWRFLLLEPIDFSQSLTLVAPAGQAVGDRVALFYLDAGLPRQASH
ncbi:MAG: family 16 glycoside hydrolase [Pirellulales bacterium]